MSTYVVCQISRLLFLSDIDDSLLQTTQNTGNYKWKGEDEDENVKDCWDQDYEDDTAVG